MPCEHRFFNDLSPDGILKYLFIGTFNPAWDKPNNDNANWFYGRRNNDFWFIMPQVFEHNSLMEKDFRCNKDFLITFCKQNQIGLTDLISTINDAEINNENHRDKILSYKDNEIETFSQIIPTNIVKTINRNAESLCGVYLTRYEHTSSNGCILNLWLEVKKCCQMNNIHCHDLVTPSRQFRSIKRTEKLRYWINTINICQNKSL